LKLDFLGLPRLRQPFLLTIVGSGNRYIYTGLMHLVVEAVGDAIHICDTLPFGSTCLFETGHATPLTFRLRITARRNVSVGVSPQSQISNCNTHRFSQQKVKGMQE